MLHVDKPSDDLLKDVRALLVKRGTSLAAFCRDHGFVRQAVTLAVRGQRKTMTTITFTLDDRLTPALNRALAGLADPTPVMGEIAQYMFTDTKQNFIRQRAPDRSVWAPKSPATIESYRRQGLGPGRILNKEGALFDSVAVNWGSDFAEVSVNQPYAAVQQFGARQGAFGRTKRNGPIPWGNIPARPFIGFEEEQQEAVIEILEDWLWGLFNAQ